MGEAYAPGRHLGRDSGWLVELFADTSGGPNVLKARAAAVAAALGAKEPSSATFDCDGIRKDLRIMAEEAHTRGFALPLAERTLAAYDQAKAGVDAITHSCRLTGRTETADVGNGCAPCLSKRSKPSE